MKDGSVPGQNTDMGEAARKEAQRLEEKKKAFEANPEKFVNKDDLLVAVVITGPDRFAVMNNCRSKRECWMAKGIVEEACDNRRDQITVMQAAEKHNGLEAASPEALAALQKNGHKQP